MKLDKRGLGYLEGGFSAFLNTVLFVFKLWAGLATGSVAMIADAWHTLSDTITSIMVVFGFWISAKPGDEEHPFGHGRAELVAAIIIGTMLGMVGISLLRESVLQLRAHETAQYTGMAVTVFAAGAVLKELLARFSIGAGKRVASQALIADGWHHRSDALASGMILIGVFVGRFFWWIDGALGIGVSLLILWAAFEIIRDAGNSIIGETPSKDLRQKIVSLAAASNGILSDLHHIHIHRYGDHTEMTVHIRMPGDVTLAKAHAAATALEERIRSSLGFETTTHLEPVNEIEFRDQPTRRA